MSRTNLSVKVLDFVQLGGARVYRTELVSQCSLAGFSLIRIDRLRPVISWIARQYVKGMRDGDGLRKIRIDDIECIRLVRQALLRTFRWEGPYIRSWSVKPV